MSSTNPVHLPCHVLVDLLNDLRDYLYLEPGVGGDWDPNKLVNPAAFYHFVRNKFEEAGLSPRKQTYRGSHK
jgi:hypothetical protein